MKPVFPSIAASFIIGASCLVWVGGITMALVIGLGLSNTAGWIIAGSLGFSSIVAVTIILYEMRHAVAVPDSVEFANLEGFPLPERSGEAMPNRPISGTAASAF